MNNAHTSTLQTVRPDRRSPRVEDQDQALAMLYRRATDRLAAHIVTMAGETYWHARNEIRIQFCAADFCVEVL